MSILPNWENEEKYSKYHNYILVFPVLFFTFQGNSTVITKFEFNRPLNELNL